MPSYATPAQFAQRYGLTETAQLLADEQQLLTPSLLLAMLAGTPVGTPEEQSAASDALDRLTRQLAICSSTMDGYLAAVVSLPLPEGDAVSTVLEECCLALARCGIADDTDNATDRADKCCDTWRAWLRDVAAGKVSLGVSQSTGQPIAAGSVRHGQTRSNWDWGSFGSSR